MTIYIFVRNEHKVTKNFWAPNNNNYVVKCTLESIMRLETELCHVFLIVYILYPKYKNDKKNYKSNSG